MLPTGAGSPGDRLEARLTRAFTILEIMIAIALFAMVLTLIYSIWMSILKGTKLGQQVAAQAQRERIAMRTLEDAFTTVQMYMANMRDYLFVADTSRDYAWVSMTSRVPDGFPGQRYYPEFPMRRLTFEVNGDHELRMTQFPLLLDTNNAPNSVYSIPLAQDVSLFKLGFYDEAKSEWLEEWTYTNRLPRLVQIVLGLGKMANSTKPHDVVTRLVAIPAAAVAGDVQGAGPGPGTGRGPLTNLNNFPPTGPFGPNRGPNQNPFQNPNQPPFIRQ